MLVLKVKSIYRLPSCCYTSILSPLVCCSLSLPFPPFFLPNVFIAIENKIHTNLYHQHFGTANRALIVINCRIIFSFCESTGGLLCVRVCRIHLSFVKMMFLERLENFSETQSSKMLSSKATHKAINLIIRFSRPP